MEKDYVEPTMLRPRLTPILLHAVGEGVRYGYNRAFKHNDNPTEQQVIDAIEDAVILSIHEWFDVV
jgi:hypothetical protein